LEFTDFYVVDLVFLKSFLKIDKIKSTLKAFKGKWIPKMFGKRNNMGSVLSYTKRAVEKLI